jgi:sporulation protein YunB
MAIFINPIVVKYSEAKIHAMTVRSVNQAIGQVLSADKYGALMVVTRDGSGRIDSVQTDMVKMNDVSGQIALVSQTKLEELSRGRLGVPVGTFTGIPMLTGRGFNVPLKVVPIGAVYCTFHTEFLGRGVNQTVHRIVLTAKATVNLIMPMGSRNITSEIDVLLCENVIVGEVPEIYLGRS